MENEKYETPRPVIWVDLEVNPNGRDTTETRGTTLGAHGRGTPRGALRVTGTLYHGETIQPRNRAAALRWLEVIGEWLEDNPDGLPVLSVDAWRDPDGGWFHNETRDTGARMPRELLDASPRRVLAWFRDVGGLLGPAARGRVAVETDGADGIEIVARGTREPLFWVPWREDENETGGEG